MSSSAKEFPEFVTDTAKRGLLQVTVTESGTLDSLKNANVTSNVQGSTTIISIVPEGTQVEAGDVVCELDASALIEQREKQEIAVTQADAENKKAAENLAIQKNQIESNLSAAELKNKLAQLDLKAFDRTAAQERSELDGTKLLAEDELSQAEEDLDFYIRNAKKGYANQQEVESRRIKVNQAKNKRDVAKTKLALLDDFTFERRRAELEENAEQSLREIERVKRSGEASLAGFQADLRARELTYKLEKEKLDKLNTQINACKLVAPQRGEVVYAEPNGRRSNDPESIQEGATVRERQIILKLPDLTQMKVNVRIHESKIRRIKTGLAVLVRLPAFADEVFHGVLDSVSPLPMSGSWPNYDLREYEAVVRITDTGTRKGELKPGMTAGVEIMIAQLQNVLLAPLQGVINTGSKHFAFVLEDDGPKRRELKVGDASDSLIQILDGIGENERVILNPRTQFADEIAELEATYGTPPSSESAATDGSAPAAGAAPAKGPAAEPAAEGDAKAGAGSEQKKEGRRKGGRKNAPRNEAAPKEGA